MSDIAPVSGPAPVTSHGREDEPPARVNKVVFAGAVRISRATRIASTHSRRSVSVER